MKKFILLLSFLLLSNSCALAQGVNGVIMNDIKEFLHIPAKKFAQKPPISDDEMTPSQQAILLYNDNDLKGAYEILLTVPDAKRNAQDYVLLGNILRDEDKISDAIFMYQRSILVDELFYKPYYNLGVLYLDEEKPFMAIENLKKACRLKKDFAYGYYNLGCAYLKAGDLGKAKIAFLKAIELKNNEPDFYFNLAYTYKKLGKEKLSKQYLELYNKAMELKGESI
ncbi:MAG TPA: tetratricopeptide repeat protein [Candidatus Gastranaerophilaceae bacterium]|nr:tetratricopeptide repeat protein [Candidatus Gastranaerophilaceae bacterium]HPT41332.1 tetratricopeptide repeat protein [Candidatus Gastranaerophilaceae bacterium]